MELLPHQRPTASRKRAQKSPDDYRFALFCVLPVEFSALTGMLDEIHDDIPSGPSDNAYVLGELSHHNVVVALVPRAGNNFPGAIAAQVCANFPSVHVGVLVGVAGGVPGIDGKQDVRLGDVVVSEATSSSEAVIQFDQGKNHDGLGLQRTGHCNKPAPLLSTTVTKLKVQHLRGAEVKVLVLIADMLRRYPHMANEFRRPSAEQDELFESSYRHTQGSTCLSCDKTKLVKRGPRITDAPHIHYGSVGSSNSLMRNAIERDRLAQSYGILCVEMEAAALSDHIPCLIVKGICDYADSHKNKVWQPYAAATAAAYTKELLSAIPSTKASKFDIRPKDDIQFVRREDEIHTEVALGRTVENSQAKLKILLQSLTFRRMDARLRNVSHALTDTCGWLNTHPAFRDWTDTTKVSQHHGFLWIKGKPGSGKSTLMKNLLAEESKVKTTQNAIVSYFFNARAPEQLEKSSLGLYRSLTYQIISTYPQVREYFVNEFALKETEGEVEDWTADELKAFLLTLAEGHLRRPLVILIDALDEGQESDIRQLIEFLEDFSTIACSSDMPLRICLSSRHYPHISIRKGLSLVMEDELGHDADIDTYVRRKLHSDPNASMESLYGEICKKSSGVFLWVVLVIPMINEGYEQGDSLDISVMSQRLRGLPDRLEDLYTRVLARNTEDLGDCLALFQWVLFARRPLSAFELYNAVGLISTSPKFQNDDYQPQRIQRCIINTSRGLTEISKGELPVVQFIHETVPEFLRKSGLANIDPKLSSNMEAHSHNTLKEGCLSYLSSTRFGVEESARTTKKDFEVWKQQISSEYPLSEYTANFMFVHAEYAENGGVSQTSFLRQMNSSNLLQLWVRIRNVYQQHKINRYKHDVPLIYALAEQGLGSLIMLLLDGGHTDSITTEKYGTALQAACALNHEKAARCLVNKGSSPREQAGKFRHHLYAAVHGGNQSVVDLLIHNGFTPRYREICNSLTNYVRDRNSVGVWAMIKASGGAVGQVLSNFCHAGKRDAVELLLAHGANVHERHPHYGSAILTAARMGHTEIVGLLIAHGADVNSQEHSGENVLYHACVGGHTDMVKLVLAHGADVHSQGGLYGNALQAACQSNNQGVVEQLLAHDADVNIQGGFFGTALSAACCAKNVDIVELLLAHGADVNCRGCRYGSPLHIARAYRQYRMAELLLSHGAVDDAPRRSIRASLRTSTRHSGDSVAPEPAHPTESNPNG